MLSEAQVRASAKAQGIPEERALAAWRQAQWGVADTGSGKRHALPAPRRAPVRAAAPAPAPAPVEPITLTIPVPPSANRWHRRVNGRTLLSEEAREYTKTLRQRLVCRPLTGELRVHVIWFRARRAGDVDKRAAIALDALQGIAFGDDAQIADHRITRNDSEPGAPRMVVRIEPYVADELPWWAR